MSVRTCYAVFLEVLKVGGVSGNGFDTRNAVRTFGAITH